MHKTLVHITFKFNTRLKLESIITSYGHSVHYEYKCLYLFYFCSSYFIALHFAHLSLVICSNALSNKLALNLFSKNLVLSFSPKCSGLFMIHSRLVHIVHIVPGFLQYSTHISLHLYHETFKWLSFKNLWSVHEFILQELKCNSSYHSWELFPPRVEA